MPKLIDHYQDVGPGWMPILERLHAQIDVLAPDYQVTQVKEKFGSLRIYLNYPGLAVEQVDAVEDLVDAAERESERICEECGKPGQLRTQGWLKTLCDEHFAAREQAKKNRWA